MDSLKKVHSDARTARLLPLHQPSHLDQTGPAKHKQAEQNVEILLTDDNLLHLKARPWGGINE